MSSAEPNRIIQTKGRYAVKYGQIVDDWSALFLSETDEHFQALENRVQKSIQAIDRAAQELKGRQRLLHFKDRTQALFYGLGVGGPYSIAAIVIATLLYFLIRDDNEYIRRQRILNEYRNATSYTLLMKNGNIIEENGALYLQLKPRPEKGDVIIGLEYIYDRKGKRVLVPLGRK